MPRFFVNLPLRWIARDPTYLETCLSRGLHPELGMDATALDILETAWHTEIAARLRDAGLSCSVHLPFMDLQPGALDPRILEATRDRLRMALDVAQIYAPRHLIGHVWYFHDLYRIFAKAWQDNAADTWEALHRHWPEHPPLYLENTFESTPDIQAGLLETLAGRGLASIQACLDLGHWHAFALGFRRHNLEQWLDALAPYLGHLHLHDNTGTDDHHLGMGRGSIPWDQLFAGLAQRGLNPTLTLEPHTPEDLEHSLAFVDGHPAWFPQA